MALVQLDFSKGIWDNNENPYDVPIGFSRYMYNWLPDEYGRLGVRYALKDTLYQASGVTVTPASYGIGMIDFNMTTLGTGSSALAGVIWFDPQNSPPSITALNKVDGLGNVYNSFAFNYGSPSFAEYNSIIYASTLTNGVRKITALNFATAAITEALVAGSPTQLRGILSFKNRLFGWNNNRVYYTDVPAPGGLPETWNTGANFFDVGSSKGTPVIYNILPVENRLYIFTDSGLFSVLVSGPATTWVQRTVDETIKIFERAACFVYKNLLYFVDEETIWVSDGVEFKNIGEAVSSTLSKSLGGNVLKRNKIFRSDNTIIFSRRELIGTVALGYVKTADLNQFKWSDIYMWTDSSFSEILGVINNVSTKDWTTKSSYIMGSLVDVVGTGFEDAYLFRKQEPSIDSIDDQLDSVNIPISCSFETGFLDFGEPLKYKTLNYVLIELSAPKELSTQLFPFIYTDQQSDGGALITMVVPGASNPFYNQVMVKVEGPEVPFKWLQFAFKTSDQVSIKNIWFDIDLGGMIEPQVYPSKGI